MNFRARVRKWVKDWRQQRQLNRYRRFIAKAARADRLHTELLTGTATPNLAKGKEVLLFSAVERPDFNIVGRACQAALNTLVPSGLSVRRMSGRSVGRRRAPRQGARTPASSRSTAHPERVLNPLTDSMAGRIEYVHHEADSADMGSWLDFVAGHDDAPIAPVVPARKQGLHRSRCILRPFGSTRLAMV